MNLLQTLIYPLLTLSVTFVTCEISSDENWVDLRHSDTGNTYSDSLLRFNKERKLSEALKSSDIQEILTTKLVNVMADTKHFLQKMVNTHQAFAAHDSTTSACVNDTGRLLTSLMEKQIWAWKFVDATGKITPGFSLAQWIWVGDYDLCRSIVAPPLPSEGRNGFKGNYCVLKAAPSNKTIPFMIQLGACMPDTCSELENTIFVHEAIQRLGLNKTLTTPMVDCRTDEREASWATIVSSNPSSELKSSYHQESRSYSLLDVNSSTLNIVFLFIIGGMMILGTAYDILYIQRPQWKAMAGKEDKLTTNHHIASDYQPIESDHRTGSNPTHDESSLLGKPHLPHRKPANSLAAQALLSFSVYTNGSNILSTDQPPGTLKAISGIRFLSMAWVILVHTYTFCQSSRDNLLSESMKLSKRWTIDVVANGFISVDTFFTLSGLLTSYGTIKDMNKKGWNINWVRFYAHRIWRLTPPYILVLFLFQGFLGYFGSGAMWPNKVDYVEMCDKNWWRNLLYINNMYPSGQNCFGHSWYLACDMQFYILSPLMIVPFYFHKYAGVASCSLFLLAHWITTGAISIANSWPVTVFTIDGGEEFYHHYYTFPWFRIGPFIVGVLGGYILSVTNGGKIRMRPYVVALGWAVATAVALAIVYGLRGYISQENHSNVYTAALYTALSKSAWAVCICWVIIACVSGYGGFVNTILSWPPLVPLGRMSYMTYLIHPTILITFFHGHGKPFYETDTTMIITYCGILFLSNLVAFVLMLGFEAPMPKLEKTFLPKERKD